MNFVQLNSNVIADPTELNTFLGTFFEATAFARLQHVLTRDNLLPARVFEAILQV